jgi:DNA-binding CsgD family transcriptional regulator
MRLFERAEDLGAVAAAIAAARDGRASILLVDGPAGIGKSALLGAAAVPAEMRHLRARGGELERELPLAVARQLLEPALAGAGDAVRAGTGAAVDALEGRAAAGDGDAAVLLNSLHRLVRNLAARRALVIEVDDVQWSDAASLRFLAFLARRLDGLPVLLLLARRIGVRSIDDPALEAIADHPLTERRSLEPLTAASVRELIEELGAARAGDEFAAACHRASAGNPFVLRQLLIALSAADAELDRAGARRVLEAGPPVVGRWVLRRLAALPPGATRLARCVAVLGPHADLGRSARLADLSLDEAGALLDELVAQDVLVAGRPLDFVHPVVRTAIHGAMGVGDRSRAHRAAARLLLEQQAAPEAVAMHLRAVEPGGEPWVAEALLAGARLALGQGSPEVAAAHLRRALDEPPPAALRAALLHTLGNAERRLGKATADDRFLAAYELTGDLRERARILLDMTITGGPARDVIGLMRSTMAALEPDDPELALTLWARMIVAMESDPLELAAELPAAEVALAAHPENTFAARLMAATLGFHKALAGASRHEVLALGMRAIGDDAAYAADLAIGYPHIYAIGALGLAGDFETTGRRLDAAIAGALERGSDVGAVLALFYRSHGRRTQGQLTAALDDARSAYDHAAPTSEPWLIVEAVSAAVLALVELGRLDEAGALLGRHRDVDRDLPLPPLAVLASTRSAHALAVGIDPAAALAHALQAGDIAKLMGVRVPGILPWRSQAARALVLLGRAEEAEAVAREALAIAEATELPAAIGDARRVLAAAVGGPHAVGLLRAAVAILETAPVPLELGRALVDLGAALRRDGRRREAREPLGRALDLASRHGAVPLARAARAELRAAGGRPRRELRTGVAALTPSERRVAGLAASGLSNAEIAARLFITTKTTEHHLAATYRKLGISSRRELGGVLGATEEWPGDSLDSDRWEAS